MRSFCIAAVLLANLSSGAVAANPSLTAAKATSAKPALQFTASPVKSMFVIGEDVLFRFRIKNISDKAVFVSRYMTAGDFVGITLIGPDGKEVPWSGKIRSVGYSKGAFLTLNPGQQVSAIHTISLFKGEGFLVTKAGRYALIAEYSLGPPEYFSNIAPKESIPEGTFKAAKVHFTIVAGKGAHR
jgi:hypothetical protein